MAKAPPKAYLLATLKEIAEDPATFYHPLAKKAREALKEQDE